VYCGEFLDDDYDSTAACLDLGYEEEDFFVFPDTPALDEALQHDECGLPVLPKAWALVALR